MTLSHTTDELLDSVPMRVHHVVDGATISGAGGRVHRLAPIATDGERRGVPIASTAEVDDFLGRCSDGLARWLALRPRERARLVNRAADRFEDATFELAEAMADDFGFTCAEAVSVTKACIEDVRRATVPLDDDAPFLPLGLHVIVLSQRLAGRAFTKVVWPLVLGGSTVVVCPDWRAPRSVTLLADLAGDAGLPDGVLNVIHGDDTTIEALASSPLISGIAGIGADDITRRVQGTAERFGKRAATVSTGH